MGVWDTKRKHRIIRRAQANRGPDLESIPTDRARGALGVSNPEEHGAPTQDVPTGLGPAAAVVEGKGRGKNEADGAEYRRRTVPLQSVDANQSERIYKVEPNGYIFGPFLYVSINESWAVFCFALSAHLPCCM